METWRANKDSLHAYLKLLQRVLLRLIDPLGGMLNCDSTWATKVLTSFNTCVFYNQIIETLYSKSTDLHANLI